MIFAFRLLTITPIDDLDNASEHPFQLEGESANSMTSEHFLKSYAHKIFLSNGDPFAIKELLTHKTNPITNTLRVLA